MVKFFKSLLCVAFMMVVMCSSEVYASEISTENDSQEVEEMNVSSRTTGTFTSTLTAYFDSTHYFDIVVYLYMDYSWEDGSYGWINEAYTIGYSDETYLSYVESSTIAILDPPRRESRYIIVEGRISL